MSQGFLKDRLAVDLYWRRHVLRADILARALCRKTGAPPGWSWEQHRRDTEEQPRFSVILEGLVETGRDLNAVGHRVPPLPWKPIIERLGLQGRCVVCARSIWRYGSHKPHEVDLKVNARASWHACCITAYRLWTMPNDYRWQLGWTPYSDLVPEVDHTIPLYRVWRDHRGTPWPDLLGYWGAGNLSVLSVDAHKAKNAIEARERADLRQGRLL